jgi:hypothetical protein
VGVRGAAAEVLDPLETGAADAQPVVVLRVGRLGDVHRAQVADDGDRHVEEPGRPHGGGHAGRAAVGKAEFGPGGPVDLREAGPDVGAHHRRLGAGQGADQVHGVAAGVHHGSAGQFQGPPDVVPFGQREAEGGLQPAYLSQLAAVHDLQHPLGQRVITPVERLHDHQPGAVRGLRHLGRLGRVGREGLLAQHVLTRLQGEQRPLGVQRVRQRDVDRVDIAVGQQVSVTVVGHRYAVPPGEGRRPGRITGRDGVAGGVGRLAGRLDQRGECDVGGTEAADPQR